MPLPQHYFPADLRRYPAGTLAVALLLLALLWTGAVAWAKPTTASQAQQVVTNWLSLDRLPLGARLGQVVKEVQTYSDSSGQALYYIVYLNPAGFVVVPGDDLVEPIIGFLPDGTYDPSPKNPLGALVSRDVPGRLAHVRHQEAQARAAGREFAPAGLTLDAQRKWNMLQQESLAPQGQELGLPNISDVRVAPLVQSRWNQAEVAGGYCYNYYTPKNYVCGCVATAMSQLMRYYRHPTAGVGTASFRIWVDGADRYENLRGGDGAGGPYVWDSMPYVPDASITEAQRQAIGALTHDTGVSVNMDYAADASGADTLRSANAFKNTFGYSNAIRGYDSGSNLPRSHLYNMVNPNLDASWPVLFGITGDAGGHAVVGDGYGYNTGTMYHHLNMGWSGSSDAWYNLPTIDTSSGTFTILHKCVYNVYVTGSGEIISGRVLDGGGSPISGAIVSATGGYSATTGSKGIYALGKVPSGSSFTVTATKTGYTFFPQVVNTGASSDLTTTTGNRWGIDFTAGVAPLTLNQALDNAALSFSTGGDAVWYGESATWFYGGSAAESGAITNSQSSWLQTTVVGPGNLSFYWKVSSEPGYDFLKFYLDGALQPGGISGEVNWVQKTFPIPDGSHIIKWEYVKDFMVSEGWDCGWVDKVVFAGPAVSHDLAPVRQLLLD